MVLFYVTAHSGCAVLKTGRRRGTCTPASWDPDDKFSPLEILAAFRTFRCPAPEKYFFTGTPDYQNIDSSPIYFESDTCCVGSSMARARRARAGFVNFRKFSPCMAHARRARGFDSLPSLSGVGTLSFR